VITYDAGRRPPQRPRDAINGSMAARAFIATFAVAFHGGHEIETVGA